MPPTRNALIVAGNVYQDRELSRLRAPGRDAEELATVLEDQNIGGFAVRLSLNASQTEVRLALEDLVALRRPDDVVLLYFACHAVTDTTGRLFFATTDTRMERLNATAISAEYVSELLEGCRSRHVLLMLDCCLSGTFAPGTLAGADRTIHAPQRFGGRGRAIITAWDGLEYAWEDHELTRLGQPSIFTTALVNALQTGEADRDRDSYISVDELYDYVFDQVRRDTPNQTPEKWSDPGETFVVARSVRSPTPASPELPPELLEALRSPFAGIREGAALELGRLLHGADADIARAAQAALADLAADDSRRVAGAATSILSEFNDLEALETSAREQLALEANLSARYEEAVFHVTAGRWPQAVAAFEQIEQLRASYRDVADRLRGARAQVRAEGRPYLDENIQFTVYRPGSVKPLTWYPLLAFAHLSERPPDAAADELDPVEEVHKQARQVLGELADKYQQVTQDSSQAIPREGELTFVPYLPGIEFNPPRRSFLWQEAVHREEFRLRASPSLDGSVTRGHLSVFLGGIVLADVALSIRVDSTPSPLAPTPRVERAWARPYRKIFASYAHLDQAIVEEVERYASVTGDHYLRDLIELRTGEVWNDRLTQLIDGADIFQLFWSWNAMHSPYVRSEWEHAASLGRPYFIRPVYWEDPLPQSAEQDLPPQTLARLHFYRIYPAPSGVPARSPASTPSTAPAPVSAPPPPAPQAESPPPAAPAPASAPPPVPPRIDEHGEVTGAHFDSARLPGRAESLPGRLESLPQRGASRWWMSLVGVVVLLSLAAFAWGLNVPVSWIVTLLIVGVAVPIVIVILRAFLRS